MRTILAATILCIATNAAAHDYTTKDGRVITWYSGNGCCNGKDCRPVKRHDGFTEKGELVVLTDDNITVVIPKAIEKKVSGDLSEHVCAKIIETPTGTSIAHCHFVPGTAAAGTHILALLDALAQRNVCRRN